MKPTVREKEIWMRIHDEDPRLAEIAGNLVEEYAEFLGVEKSVFGIDVDINRGLYVANSVSLKFIDKRQASIKVTKWIFGRLSDMAFAHEVRHILDAQVTRNVIEEDPVRFMQYFEGTYSGKNPESIDRLLKPDIIDNAVRYSKADDTDKLIGIVTGLDRTNPDELRSEEHTSELQSH